MREWEITWVKRGAPMPEGEFVELPEYCHHGRYVSGMVVREISPEPERCLHCGNPLIEDWNGAHYSCVTCKSVTTACCGGASDGQSG